MLFLYNSWNLDFCVLLYLDFTKFAIIMYANFTKIAVFCRLGDMKKLDDKFSIDIKQELYYIDYASHNKLKIEDFFRVKELRHLLNLLLKTKQT